MSLLSVDEIRPLLYQGKDWVGHLPPVKNQGSCGNCWAHSLVTILEGMVNRYTPQKIREEWAKRDDNPFKDGLVSLSVRQMTECTDYNWLQTIKDSPNIKGTMEHLDDLWDEWRLSGCKGGSYFAAFKYASMCQTEFSDTYVPNYDYKPCDESLLAALGLGTWYDSAITTNDENKIEACRKGFVRFNGAYGFFVNNKTTKS